MGPIFYVQNNSSLLQHYNKSGKRSVGKNDRPSNNFNDPSQIYGIDMKKPNQSKIIHQMAPRINLANNKLMKRVSPSSLSPKSPK